MIGVLVTGLFAIGLFLFTVSLPARSAGAPLRRFALTLIAIPLAACVFLGSFFEAVRQSGGVHSFGLNVVAGLGMISVISYVILAVRRRFGARSEKTPTRIREKRPIDKRRSDFISYIREELDDRDE